MNPVAVAAPGGRPEPDFDPPTEPVRVAAVSALNETARVVAVGEDPRAVELMSTTLEQLGADWTWALQAADPAAVLAASTQPESVLLLGLLPHVRARPDELPRRLAGQAWPGENPSGGGGSVPSALLAALARGLAADLAVSEGLAGGADGGCAQLGDVARCGGLGPRRSGWSVALPAGGGLVRLREGAVACGPVRGGWLAVVAANGWQAAGLAVELRNEPHDGAVLAALARAGAEGALLRPGRPGRCTDGWAHFAG